MTFTDNKDGTATLSGTPTTAGTYAIPLIATNAYGSVQQTLTITIAAGPGDHQRQLGHLHRRARRGRSR